MKGVGDAVSKEEIFNTEMTIMSTLTCCEHGRMPECYGAVCLVE